tara:strand:+ start:57 stop:236 length:180 start_codon:yes stop_codon:yes gene_type:complete
LTDGVQTVGLGVGVWYCIIGAAFGGGDGLSYFAVKTTKTTKAHTNNVINIKNVIVLFNE